MFAHQRKVSIIWMLNLVIHESLQPKDAKLLAAVVFYIHSLVNEIIY